MPKLTQEAGAAILGRMRWAGLLFLALLCWSTSGWGQEDTATSSTERGRQAFARGVQLSHDEHWGDALTQFEEAAAARDAPLVQFNIAYCQRALGRYVAARRTVLKVIANPAGLDPAQVDDTKAYLSEFDKVIARVHVTLDPPTAALTIDGRPLIADDRDPNTFLAGVGPAAEAKPLGKPSFDVLFDPTTHLVRASREGHHDALVHPSYRAGEVGVLDLHLDILPATIVIKSEPSQGIVKLDGREVGVAPIEFQRPAGNYKLEVVRDRFETYSASLALSPGQRAELTTKLSPYTAPLTKRWWFWSGAIAIVAGGILLTYFVTRPTPQPPPYDGGSAGWVVYGQGLRFY